MLKFTDFIEEDVEEGYGAIGLKTRVGRKLCAKKTKGKRTAGRKRFRFRKADAK